MSLINKSVLAKPGSGGNGETIHNNLTGIQGGQALEYYHLLAADYTELSQWLDDVTLGSDGITSIPQLVLIPSAAALQAIEGGMFYNNADKSVYVCTDI
jgi:hypothetical protein